MKPSLDTRDRHPDANLFPNQQGGGGGVGGVFHIQAKKVNTRIEKKRMTVTEFKP